VRGLHDMVFAFWCVIPGQWITLNSYSWSISVQRANLPISLSLVINHLIAGGWYTKWNLCHKDKAWNVFVGVPCYALGRHLCSTLGNMPLREPSPWLAERRQVHSSIQKASQAIPITCCFHGMLFSCNPSQRTQSGWNLASNPHNCEDVWISNAIKQFFKDGHGVPILRCN